MDITGIDAGAKELTQNALPQVTAAMGALEASVAEDVAVATKAISNSVAAISGATTAGVESLTQCLADAVGQILGTVQQLDGAEITIKIKLGQKLPTA